MRRVEEPGNSTAESLRRSFDATFAAPPELAPDAFEAVLAIRIARHPYAIRLSEIAGLHVDRILVEVPGPFPELLGIAAVRGMLTPVYDLALLLGHAQAARGRWFVVARAPHPVALAFSDFETHLRLSTAALVGTAERGADSPPGTAAAHVRGSVQADGLLRPLLDVAAVVATIEGRIRTHASSREDISK